MWIAVLANEFNFASFFLYGLTMSRNIFSDVAHVVNGHRLSLWHTYKHNTSLVQNKQFDKNKKVVNFKSNKKYKIYTFLTRVFNNN